MTKAELIDRIARSARGSDLPPEVTKKVIVKVLDLAFAELSDYFVRSRVTRSTSPRFSYPKFGTFPKKQRSSRRGVNPRTLVTREEVELEPATKPLLSSLPDAPYQKVARRKRTSLDDTGT